MPTLPLPIVLVPGILGTRLAEPSGRKVYDVWMSGSRFALDPARLRDPAPLVPVGVVDNLPRFFGRLTPAEEAIARAIPGFGGLVFDCGGRLAIRLASDPSFLALLGAAGRSPAVYVAGYDWRKSNGASARTLSGVVARALADTGSREVVIVAHSMGGLVSRWFCRFGHIGGVPASVLLAGLILLGSPTHGAPKAYRQLKLVAGLLREMPEEGPPEQFLGALSGLGRDLSRSMPSVYQLLPNATWCAAQPNWLRFNTTKAGIPDASRPVRLYANRYAGLMDDPATNPMVSARLASRRGFHARLGGFMPARTALVYSGDVPTEGAYNLVESRIWGFSLERPQPLADGNGTVPLFSAAAVGATAARRVRLSSGVSHVQLPDHPLVFPIITSTIGSFMAAPSAAPELAPELALV